MPAACTACVDALDRTGSSGSPFSAALNARDGILAIVLLLIFCGGCQSVSNPLSQWRAAYDGNLVKGPTKEEMADASGPSDSQNLFERWITPRMSPANQFERHVADRL